MCCRLIQQKHSSLTEILIYKKSMLPYAPLIVEDPSCHVLTALCTNTTISTRCSIFIRHSEAMYFIVLGACMTKKLQPVMLITCIRYQKYNLQTVTEFTLWKEKIEEESDNYYTKDRSTNHINAQHTISY